MTLLFCIAACGAAIKKPLVILPQNGLPDLPKDLFNKFDITGNDSGWMTREIYGKFIEAQLLPFIQKQRAKCKEKYGADYNDTVLLWTDGHNSRCNLIATQLLERHNVKVVVIPSHTSHLLAPLDK